MFHIATVAMAMILHSSSLSSRYIDMKPLPNISYHIKQDHWR